MDVVFFIDIWSPRGIPVEWFRACVSEPVERFCLIEFEWKMSVGGGRLIGVD